MTSAMLLSTRYCAERSAPCAASVGLETTSLIVALGAIIPATCTSRSASNSSRPTSKPGSCPFTIMFEDVKLVEEERPKRARKAATS